MQHSRGRHKGQLFKGQVFEEVEGLVLEDVEVSAAADSQIRLVDLPPILVELGTQ